MRIVDMAGLKKDNLYSEILVELSWMMSAIDEICAKMEIETYRTALIKYRVQPEEERAIHTYLFLHWKEIDSLSLVEIEKGIAHIFAEDVGLTWSLSRDVLETLVRLWKLETPLKNA